jgi:hypothetical protein
VSYYVQEFKSQTDIVDQYSGDGITPEQIQNDLLDAEILLAWYGYGSYCGASLVIYRKDGKLYEVNGGHCSCYGLEGQWKPEETSWDALDMRHIAGEEDGSAEAETRLKELIAAQRESADAAASPN